MTRRRVSGYRPAACPVRGARSAVRFGRRSGRGPRASCYGCKLKQFRECVFAISVKPARQNGVNTGLAGVCVPWHCCRTGCPVWKQKVSETGRSKLEVKSNVHGARSRPNRAVEVKSNVHGLRYPADRGRWVGLLNGSITKIDKQRAKKTPPRGRGQVVAATGQRRAGMRIRSRSRSSEIPQRTNVSPVGFSLPFTAR